jgi:hypothetical protein
VASSAAQFAKVSKSANPTNFRITSLSFSFHQQPAQFKALAEPQVAP